MKMNTKPYETEHIDNGECVLMCPNDIALRSKLNRIRELAERLQDA